MTVLQMHTHQWIASFGNPGNGQYREELRRANASIQAYVKAHSLPAERTLLRLDGQYGSGAVVADLTDFSYVSEGSMQVIVHNGEDLSPLANSDPEHVAMTSDSTNRHLRGGRIS